MNKTTIITLITAAAALVGIGVSVAYENHQTNKKIGDSVENLKEATVRDITESMLREAVNKAANSAVDKYVSNDNDSILKKANQYLDQEVNRMVGTRFDEVTKDVSERLAKRVSELDDPERLQRTVCKRAEDILANRFNADLDGIRKRAEDRLSESISSFENKLDDKLDGYSESLAGMKKVYESIDKAFGHRSDRDGDKAIRFVFG